MPYEAFRDGSRRQKGDVLRQHRDKLARRNQRRIERAARKTEREAAGIAGPEIDWNLAVNTVADTPYEGVARTLARGD